jgi:hypothetical protein
VTGTGGTDGRGRRGGSAVVAGSRSRGRGGAGKEPSVEDLLLPAVPGLISSLLLEVLGELTGLQKLAVGTGLGLLLWWLVRRRQRPRGRPGSRRWRWVVLALAGAALLVLAVTVVVFDRPTPSTAWVTLVALGVLSGFALTGRPGPGAGAAALSGALIGFCVGIALL